MAVFLVGYIYLFSWHVIGIFNSLWFVIDIFNFSWSVNRQLTVNCDCIVLFIMNGDCLSENPVNCDLNINRDTWFRLLSVKYLRVAEIFIRDPVQVSGNHRWAIQIYIFVRNTPIGLHGVHPRQCSRYIYVFERSPQLFVIYCYFIFIIWSQIINIIPIIILSFKTKSSQIIIYINHTNQWFILWFCRRKMKFFSGLF